MYGSVRGVPGNRHSYRDKIKCLITCSVLSGSGTNLSLLPLTFRMCGKSGTDHVYFSASRNNLIDKKLPNNRVNLTVNSPQKFSLNISARQVTHVVREAFLSKNGKEK